MKHLEDLAKHGAGNPRYLRLLGQTHQKALHSAINRILKRGEPLVPKGLPQKRHTIGGVEITFAAPRKLGELPTVIHFRIK